MRVRLSPRASVTTLLIPLLYAPLATAQQPSLHGTVVSTESGEPLGFSIVSLRPNGGRQFTDSAGAFAFTAPAAGSYVLSVRQIGYTPLDTQIVIRGDSTTVVRVALRHLAIELPPVTIAGSQCTKPGRPDSSDAALFAVFDQLQENARRFALLVDSYPFHYELELSLREVSQRGDTGRPAIRRLRFESTDTHPYAVGRVVEPGWGPWGSPDNVLVIRSADLEDLGNEDFIANHCFHLAGRDTIGGETLVRLDFEPALRIGSADMAGTAFLDPTTYELRYTITTLTRPDRSALTNVKAMTFRTRFRNIAPGVPLQDSLTAVTTYRYGRRTKIDTQRTVEVRFRRQPLR
ncbi:MAG TPA: carboxypeptidase-like regulatory domain-containing protein [Gemmatimonadales bacterium]|nr:carboxypeptidase-like regulatory domain-containing protein [Gemmatimonadales bacterium]